MSIPETRVPHATFKRVLHVTLWLLADDFGMATTNINSYLGPRTESVPSYAGLIRLDVDKCD